MAVIDAGGLGGALVNRPDGELQPNRPDAGRVSGTGRAAGETGARSGGDAVVVDLSPTARAIVESGPQAVRESDVTPGANDALSRAAAGGGGPAPTDALIPAAAAGGSEEAGEVVAGPAAGAEEAAENEPPAGGSPGRADRSAEPAAGERFSPVGRRLSVTV
ncbi:MAG: hypothetical protein D6740_06890 [Alphaproteobacteria bacterium]|nr:MAG: hypothetical protein D6740_06890 [Alphaproteobacteria bacterium]